MSRVEGATTTGEARTSSTVTGDLNWARGLRAPHRRALAAAAAICSGVVPRSSIWWRTHVALSAMSTLPASFSRRTRSSARSSDGNPSSIPAMVSPRWPVHIFSTPDDEHR